MPSVRTHILFPWLVGLISLLMTNGAWGQPLQLGAYRAVQDSLNGFWLCCVPQTLFGTDWETDVTADSTWNALLIGGQDAAAGPVTFEGITGGKLYPLTAMSDGKPVTGNITFTWLPVLELNGDFGAEYSEGTVSLCTADSTAKSDMRAKLKWRGNHSNNERKHKRNYSIKFLGKDGNKKDRRLLGLRKDNHWKLDAGQSDLLRVRNRVATDLWLEMSTPVWYHEAEPTAINGSRGKMVEVILNGKYNGIYNLMEPVDRKQLQLVKHDTVNNVFHGQMWYSRHWCRTATMSAPVEWSNDSDRWDGIWVEYPDFEEVNPTDWSTLADAVDFVRRTDDADVWPEMVDSLDSYFDMPVMEDYFIFIVTLQALDNECKNLFYSVHDKTTSHMLTMTPWDLNMTVGGALAASSPADMARPDRPLDWISHLPMYAIFNISARHRRDIVDRYRQLRHTWLDTDNLVARYQRAIDELEQSGAAAREEARWSGDSDIAGQVLDISAEMQQVAQWIRQRMVYLDENVFLLCEDVNRDGEVNIADINATVNTILLPHPQGDSPADVNGDGEVNIADVNAIINAITSN